jgi:hypothetical protein
MVDYMLEPDEFPQILACAWCDKPHLDCDGFLSHRDEELSFCSENCANEYDNEEEDE